MALPVAAIAAPLIGGILGNVLSQGDRSAADDNMKQSLAAYENISLPDLEKMRLALEEQQSVGSLTPTMEGVSSLGPTALQNIALDPKYNQYTMQALQKMSEVSEQGLPEADRAQLQNLLNANNQQNVSQQKAILENRAARGMGGSGDELAAQLQASQSGSNRASNEAMQLAALAAERKLNATQNLGALANTLSQTDYGRQRDLYGQTDAIAQFNANQTQGANTRNTDRSNVAQAGNLANAQNISNNNTATRNQQQQFNRGLEQQQFDNSIRKAGGVSSGYQNMANLHSGNAAATGNMWSQIGSAAGQGFAAGGSPAAAKTGAPSAEELGWDKDWASKRTS